MYVLESQKSKMMFDFTANLTIKILLLAGCCVVTSPCYIALVSTPDSERSSPLLALARQLLLRNHTVKFALSEQQVNTQVFDSVPDLEVLKISDATQPSELKDSTQLFDTWAGPAVPRWESRRTGSTGQRSLDYFVDLVSSFARQQPHM